MFLKAAGERKGREGKGRGNGVGIGTSSGPVRRVVKGKAIPVTGRGAPQDCETSRVSHFLDSRFTDGGDVSLTRRLPFTPMKISDTHFC
jgi:hypothetical protein